jgi:hypothetical protein
MVRLFVQQPTLISLIAQMDTENKGTAIHKESERPAT